MPGRPVSASTVRHRRQRWQAEGLPGLVDRRVTQRRARPGRADPAVAGAMEQAIAGATDDSSRTATFIVWRTRQILAERGQVEGGAVAGHDVPAVLPAVGGKHTTGSAATRRGPSTARPQRMFAQAHPAAPGELMEIDSTPLDVLVLLDDGVPGRVELTGLIDVATRTVPAAVISPTAKSVDASVLLARALTPEPMRPGWPASLAMAHSALPYDRLLGIDERLEHAAARPVITPDTIVIDHGSVFVSDNFRASCRHLGISIQPAHLATGSDKPHIEKMFSSLGTLFCQFAGATKTAAATSTNTITPNTGYHTIRCIKTSSQIQAVLDGVTTTTSAQVGSITNHANVVLGAHTGGNNDFYKGTMDEASITIG